MLKNEPMQVKLELKVDDIVRIQRVYLSREQQDEEAEFGWHTDNTGADGLTVGTVVKADFHHNEYLVDVGDECDVACSLKLIHGLPTLVERR
jgi:hypothetical protein